MTDERDELIRLVEQIIDPGDVSEGEHDALIAEVERRVPRRTIVDLVYHPEDTEGRHLLKGRDELTAEEIVDLALSFKPIQL